MGDYFDDYLPPYLLESNDGGASFGPSLSATKVTNKNVHTLHVAPPDETASARVCACTDGNGAQCFVVLNAATTNPGLDREN